MTWNQYGNDCHNAGLAEGRAEGKEKTMQAAVQRLLEKGKSPEEISDLLGYDLSFISEVQKEMLVEA